jgi:hypothetical protein
LLSCPQAEKFRHLQSQLRDRQHSVDLFDQDDHDILLVPSVSVEQRELKKLFLYDSLAGSRGCWTTID